MAFFPSAYHVIHGNPYAQNIVGSLNYIGNQGLTAILYALFIYWYVCNFHVYACLMRKICFLN